MLKGKVKFIVWALVVVAIIAFFLPFLKFNIMSGYMKISFSAFQVAVGTDISSGAPLAFIMLILPLAAFAFSFIKNNKTRAILYFVEAVLVIVLSIIYFVSVKSKMSSSLEASGMSSSLVSTGIGFGFILYMIHGVGMIVAGVLDMKAEE